MIVVTGATGQLGGMVVERLLDRVSADQVGVSVRDAQKAQPLAERGVRVRQADYDDQDSLVRALEGADRVLLISAPRMRDALIAAHRTAIEAARAANVGRLLYTSHIGSDPVSPFPPNRGHAATETMLRDSGVPFTILRNGFYTATPARTVAGAVGSGELRAPADAPVSWTTHEDLAEGIATLLLADDLTEPVANLTAGEALDAAGLAALGAEITGRSIDRVVVPDADFHAELVQNGVPAIGADMALGLWAASRQRRFGVVDPTLGELIARPTTPLRSVLERALATADAAG